MIHKFIIAFIARLLVVWFCMLIWNSTIVDIISTREITYWETILLYIFCHFMTQRPTYNSNE